MTAEPLFGLAGAALLLLALVDMLWTTVAASAGAGPVTAHLSKGLWDLARRYACRGNRVRHRPLRLVSVLIVAAVFSSWLLLAWAGWTLVFLADADAVLATVTGASASVAERVYFAGYAMATLGNGEFAPNGTLWQLLTVTATLSGFALATMGITYLVPVVGAVTDRRAKALHITSLGGQPTELVLRAWHGEAWRHLESEFLNIGPALALLGQRHLAYPILHFFHDVDVDAAAAVRIAVLDEAVTLLQHGIAPDARPSAFVLEAMRRSLNTYLGALRAAYIEPSDDPPPVPDLAPLRDAGIPTVEDEEFRQAMEELAERRRTLQGAVRDDGWTWEDVCGTGHADAGDEREGIDIDDFQDDDAGTEDRQPVSG